MSARHLRRNVAPKRLRGRAATKTGNALKAAAPQKRQISRRSCDFESNASEKSRGAFATGRASYLPATVRVGRMRNERRLLVSTFSFPAAAGCRPTGERKELPSGSLGRAFFDWLLRALFKARQRALKSLGERAFRHRRDGALLPVSGLDIPRQFSTRTFSPRAKSPSPGRKRRVPRVGPALKTPLTPLWSRNSRLLTSEARKRMVKILAKHAEVEEHVHKVALAID